MRAVGSRIFRATALFQKAFEVFDGVSPAITLVLDVALQDRERRRGATGGEIVDRAGQGNGVGKARDFGEEAPDLDVGVDAIAHTSERFQEQALAERHPGIAGVRGSRA